MKCQRCGGFVVSEWLIDKDASHKENILAHRCINCGDLKDPRLLHRQQEKPVLEKVGRQARRVLAVSLRRAS